MIDALHAMANSKNTTIKTFEYRIRPNKQFIAACEKALDDSRFVYNCALEQRIRVYNASGKTIRVNHRARTKCANLPAPDQASIVDTWYTTGSAGRMGK